MALETQEIELADWVLRVHEPGGEGAHPVIVLLHGWTGDEKVMWVFADALPEESWVFAPRGIFPTAQGGYGWQSKLSRSYPDMDDFLPAAQAVRGLLSDLKLRYPDASLGLNRPIWMGFSQGAALTYSLALRYPALVAAVMGLAGFVPNGAVEYVKGAPLKDIPVFVTHGTQDTLVPVTRARQAVQLLEQAGARVSYCEDDVGHKLSANCLRGMQFFMQQLGLLAQ